MSKKVMFKKMFEEKIFKNKNKKWCNGFFLLTVICLISLEVSFFQARAANIVWNGFGSVYGKKSLTHDVYENSMGSPHVNFYSDSRVGLNMRSDFEKDWVLAAQIVASGRTISTSTSNPTWSPEFDWFYLGYNPSNSVNIKVGRQLFPFGLVAEFTDVGLVYPWVRQPEQAASPIKTLEGVSASYQLKFAELIWTGRVFAGSNAVTLSAQDQNLTINNLLGVRLGFENDDWEFQTTLLKGDAKLTTRTIVSTPTVVVIDTDLQAQEVVLWTAGTKFDNDKLLFYAEYGEYGTDHGTQLPSGDKFLNKRQFYYATMGYYFGKIVPHYTYAYTHSDIGVFIGDEISNAVGLNYEVNPSVVFKAQHAWWKDTDGKVTLNSSGSSRIITAGFDFVF